MKQTVISLWKYLSGILLYVDTTVSVIGQLSASRYTGQRLLVTVGWVAGGDIREADRKSQSADHC